MWLINTSTFQLHEFPGCAPHYATFTYFTEKNGSLFEELAQLRTKTCQDGLKIIQRACDQARAAGTQWLWNDAACVDKRSSAAQSEAINSFAQIYRNCEFSIIYLQDLYYKPAADGITGEMLAECRWIKNIWAIPQIIFSRVSHFYSSHWNHIGTKESLLPQLSSVIGIDQAVLADSDCLEDYSIARRMSWASVMSALRTEDFAYALLGVFDVSIPIIYGEGRKAFLRLQEEILRNTSDFSLFAWETCESQEYTGLFAQSPACFRHFRQDQTTALRIHGDLQIHCQGITIEASLWRTPSGLFLPLEGPDGPACWVPLFQWNSCFVRRGGKLEWDFSGPVSLENRKVCVRRDVSAHDSRKIIASGNFQKDQSHSGLTHAFLFSRLTSSERSRDQKDSIIPPVDDCGVTPQYANSVCISEITSREDPIAWSSHGRSSVAETMSARGSIGAPSWTHESASEAHGLPEPFAEADNTVTVCIEAACEEVKDGLKESVQLSESPSTQTQSLDGARFTEELANIATEQFLSGFQRQSVKRSFRPWQSENRKRPKLMDSSDHLEIVETSDSEDGETVVVRKARFFACPFYIQDNKHSKCVTEEQLQNIEQVKDHLWWAHRQPIFCPVCKEQFPSSKTRDTHIRLRTCHPKISSSIEGLTGEQDEKLAREEEEPQLSEEMRWFRIWDIIFPHIARPPSPFYTGQRELNVCAFRRFWMESGENIIADFLEKKESQSYNIRNEERELRALYNLVLQDVVCRIFAESCDRVTTC
ncbi:Vegetative incompatibility protein HET-E-1 [Diaporthe amygdali]|uniref:Vegetative incompatibility protein HET-E-1 n=1 Tax=Phomopsis amygdali TaxID=1214568 RepID=UPI0022FEAA19|nr:Vegetative incompatibility protein HET-E-1 [Diaporthe amygdali]KAJ0120904.1 Vegetative incompatibility protein HET-E-1 [Diaporthe amygdali]